jgi:hypothetical protein
MVPSLHAVSSGSRRSVIHMTVAIFAHHSNMPLGALQQHVKGTTVDHFFLGPASKTGPSCARGGGGSVRLVDVRAVASGLSDHFPVVADFVVE